jgi:hypothetical protein
MDVEHDLEVGLERGADESFDLIGEGRLDRMGTPSRRNRPNGPGCAPEEIPAA